MTIDFESSPSGLIHAIANAQNFSPISYSWTFEGGNNATTSEVAFFANTAIPVERICLEVRDGKNNKYTICKDLLIDSTNTCVGNFGFSRNEGLEISHGLPGERVITISLLLNNTKWSSVNNSGQLSIISSEPYLQNENGLLTRRLNIRGQGEFVNSSGDFISLIIHDGFIAVAIPN